MFKKTFVFRCLFFSSKIFFAHLRQIQIKTKQSEIFLSGKEKRVRFFYFIFVLSRTRKKKKKKLIESCRPSFSVRNCSVGKISMSSISTSSSLMSLLMSSSLMSLSSSLSSPTTSNQRCLQLFWWWHSCRKFEMQLFTCLLHHNYSTVVWQIICELEKTLRSGFG